MSRKIDRAVALVFVLVGAYVLVESYVRLPYKAEYGPGPGFLPTLLGLCTLLVSFALLIQTFTSRNHEDMPKVGQEIGSKQVGRVLAILLLLMGSIFLLDILGFFISYALLVFSLIYLLERDRLSLRVILATSVLMPIAFTFVFKFLLSVALPVGFLGL